MKKLRYIKKELNVPSFLHVSYKLNPNINQYLLFVDNKTDTLHFEFKEYKGTCFQIIYMTFISMDH